MIGNVIEIGKDSVDVKLVIDDSQKKSLINFHVMFDTDNTKIVGEISSINESIARVFLVGEIVDNKFIPGISKKPFFAQPCRIITKDELPIIVGNNRGKSVYIGRLQQYGGYQINVSINDLFSNHFAILGNTGSGKSYGLTRIIQNLFLNPSDIPKKSNFFLFDAYGEYNNALKNLGDGVNPSSKIYTTRVGEFQDANTELLKIPLWLLDVDDYALLLGAEKTTQIPIIEKALKLVSIFSRSEQEIIDYKNDIIARALLEILYGGGTPSQIRDQLFAVLTSFNTKDLNLDSKVIVPGWTRPFRHCLIIDKDGKLPEMQLIGEFLSLFKKDNLDLSFPDGSYTYTLDNLKEAFDFALISEGVLKSSKIYDEYHTMKVRLHTLANSDYKEYFNVTEHITEEQYIKNLVKSVTGNKVQVIDFNISYVDDRFAKVLVKILSRKLFNYSLALENRSSFPVHILLEEAHRYVQNDDDTKILGYNIFERITKEGRKYGVILGMISQRPSEISETAISQCTNFLVFRMQHPKDLNYVKDMISSVNEEVAEKFKILQPGSCVAFGMAFKLPLVLKLDLPNPEPLSQNVDIVANWY